MKKSKHSQLEELYNAQYSKVSRNSKYGDIANSIDELLHQGKTRTGCSGYDRHRGAYKHVWTDDIVEILKSADAGFD